MARFRLISRAKTFDNSGMGNISGRFTDKETGIPRVNITGVPVWQRFSAYHTFMKMSRLKFLLVIFLGYMTANLFFAAIYWFIGIEHFPGIIRGKPLHNFLEVFFFSSQTFTTVGYGRISPEGFLASFVATTEAFTGLLFLAVATGLFFGRFSRPRAFLRFSHNMLIAPYKDGTALMFRLAPYRNNMLSDAEIVMNTAFETEEDGKPFSRYYRLPTTLQKINTLSLNWTIVHPIDEESPFFGMTAQDFAEAKFEVFVYLTAFDEIFANSVVQRASYTSDELVYGAKFIPMYSDGEDGSVLDLSKLNSYVEVPL